jgi:cobaltochelatase CobN
MMTILKHNRRGWGLAVCLFFMLLSNGRAEQISILEIDINSYQIQKALKRLKLPESIQTRFFTVEDLKENRTAKEFIAHSAVVFVNVMMPELADFMVNEKLISGRCVYALNQAADPKRLFENYL